MLSSQRHLNLKQKIEAFPWLFCFCHPLAISQNRAPTAGGNKEAMFVMYESMSHVRLLLSS